MTTTTYPEVTDGKYKPFTEIEYECEDGKHYVVLHGPGQALFRAKKYWWLYKKFQQNKQLFYLNTFLFKYHSEISAVIQTLVTPNYLTNQNNISQAGVLKEKK